MAEKRGITVKVDEDLHRQVREYVESRGITMADFVSQALEEMLHPKQQMGGTMENNRTIAFQVSEELYRRIKDYLTANHLTQKEFMIGLIESIVNNVVFPVLDVILVVLLFVKIAGMYLDYRKHGQLEWAPLAIIFGGLLFSLTAPLYIWSII